jgi:hypothetical protein
MFESGWRYFAKNSVTVSRSEGLITSRVFIKVNKSSEAASIVLSSTGMGTLNFLR